MNYIGVDVGGTGIKAGVVDESGKIIAKGSIETNVAGGYKEIVKDTAQLIEDVITQAGMTFDDIKSIGIGSPGSIDDKNGEIIYSNNLNFKNVPFCLRTLKQQNRRRFPCGGQF